MKASLATYTTLLLAFAMMRCHHPAPVVHIATTPAMPPAFALLVESRPDLTSFVADARNGFIAQGTPFNSCPCDFTLNPVCGENGVTYANYCRAACKNIKPVHYGQCGVLTYGFDSRNRCQCDFNSTPACATNGITYENTCVSRCFNASIDFSGYCTQPCSCRFFFKPVCGENGKNYINQCVMDCAQVNKFSDGLCANDTKCGKCFGQIQRVCGKDGKTYDNECYMQCAGVKKQNDGYCVERWSGSMYDPYSNTSSGYGLGNTVELPAELDKCFCPKNYLPVCGKNNATYANECELNCAGAIKASNNACNSQPVKEDTCILNSKTLSYEPVCGSNRVTYYNKNSIACDSGVSVLYNGECKPIYYEWCKGRIDVAPVCGIDGRTYLNEDVLKCVGVEKYCDGTCELGASGWKVGSEQKGSIDKFMRAGKYEKRYDDTLNEYWYNAIWGTHKGEWICNKNNDPRVQLSCKPQTNIKYVLADGPQQNGAVMLLPPCFNLEHFTLPYKNNFPGFQGFIPDVKYLTHLLTSSYKNSELDIESILKIVFSGKSSIVDTLKLFLPLSNSRTKSAIRKEIGAKKRGTIPEDHKLSYTNDASLYYLYFNLLLQQKVVTADTKINDNYCVRDALLFIVEDIWKLGYDKVNKTGKDIDFDISKLVRF